MYRKDLTPEEMVIQAVTEAIAEADIRPTVIGTVVVANALGGRLWDQGCIRGQTWMRDLGLAGCGIVNVDNSCGSGGTAMHLGVMAAQVSDQPVLVVGVEKMWTGDREATLAGIEDGLPREERAKMREMLPDDSGSILMEMNASWAKQFMDERGTTAEQIAATAAKAFRSAARNPLAQFHRQVTTEEILASPMVSSPLTRLMCSSFTDGAAAAVLTSGAAAGAPRVISSVIRSGDGSIDYHQRVAEAAEEAWKEAGVGPGDMDLVEIHDATSAEELYSLESLGFFDPGESGPATAAGDTDLGGRSVSVNPSGGLVGRGHPLGATGLCQIAEVVRHLRGQAGDRQIEGARLATTVNCGGIISGDAALVAIHVLTEG
jgi:acetyl-CoA acetyltransferase